MPKYDLNVTGVASSHPSFTATGGSVPTVLGDASNATYVRANAERKWCYLEVEPPTAPVGRLVAVAPTITSKRSAGRRARVGVFARKIAADGKTPIAALGIELAVPADGSATVNAIAADHAAVLDSGWYYPAACFAALIGLFDANTGTARAYIYEALLTAYYLAAIEVEAPSAPSGTINTQTPTCVVDVGWIVEDWQLLTDQSPWLCDGWVTFLVYQLVDGEPTGLPRHNEGEHIEIATYTDGVTPTTLEVSHVVSTPLVNGDYRLVVLGLRRGYVASESAYVDFTVDFAGGPETPTGLTATADNALQRVAIEVTIPETIGFTEALVTVQRSDDAGATYTDVRGMVDLPTTPDDGSPLDCGYDYEAPRGAECLYRARAYELSGAAWYMSDWCAPVAADGPSAEGWSLKCPEDPTLNMAGVRILQGPTWTGAEERTTHRPLDRGEQVVSAALRAGRNGSWTVRVDGADIAALRALVESQLTIFAETAFGESFYVRITDDSWSQEGTTAAPRATVGLAYAQVGAPPVS